MSSKKNKASANELIPGDLFHPGEHLRDELEARGMSQQELAVKLKMSKSEISLLVNGHRDFNPLFALKLEQTLGINAEFWMNLQIKFELDTLRKKYKRLLSSSKISLPRQTRLNNTLRGA